MSKQPKQQPVKVIRHVAVAKKVNLSRRGTASLPKTTSEAKKQS